MTTQIDIQALLRFLTTNAKLPLATAMTKIKDLRAASITNVETLSKTPMSTLQSIFANDEKLAKQVLNAAKRSSKKRDAPSEESAPSPTAKKRARAAQLPGTVLSLAEVEDSLRLPELVKDEELLSKTVLITNRAPLVLAFAVTLLKYTMPRQPLSTRLSLAQAVVSMNSRSKAVSIGLESGKSAEEEGYGAGQPVVRVMGRDVRTMRRHGYDAMSSAVTREDTQDTQGSVTVTGEEGGGERELSLWGLDLEAMRKSATQQGPALGSGLPIYTPQSARAYLLKSFDQALAVLPPSVKTEDAASKTKKKPSGLSVSEKRERNLGLLLGALELLFDSWADTLDADALDRRAWSWYMTIRPAVENGVAGWGGKGEVKLGDILGLRCTP